MQICNQFRFLIVIKQNRSVGIRHHQVTNFGFFFIFHIFNQLINILDFFLKMAIMMELTANNNNNTIIIIGKEKEREREKEEKKSRIRSLFFSLPIYVMCLPHYNNNSNNNKFL